VAAGGAAGERITSGPVALSADVVSAWILEKLGFFDEDDGTLNEEKRAAVESVGPIDAWDAYESAQSAREKSANLPGSSDGAGDAFRHCYWSCDMALGIGEDQAEEIASNHELHNPPGDGQPLAAPEMDEANNAAGRECSQHAFFFSECVTCCMAKLGSGELQQIDPGSGELVPSGGALVDAGSK
jgi:hypothetical protein